jgi:hypothetical protein
VDGRFVDDPTHEQFLAQIESGRAAIRALMSEYRFRCDALSIPTAESTAIADMASLVDLQQHLKGDVVIECSGLAGLCLLAAEDALSAIERLVCMREPVLYADRVLGRTALEAAGWAHWIVEPAASAQLRAARTLSQRLATLDETVRLLEGSDQHPHALERRADLLTQVERAGLPVIFDKNGKRILGVVEQRPSSTNVMRTLWGPATNGIDVGLLAQRYFSLFVHANPAGLMQARMKALPPGVEVPAMRPGAVASGLASSSSGARFVLGLVGSGFAIAADDHLRYLGGADSDWVSSLREVRSLLRGLFDR